MTPAANRHQQSGVRLLSTFALAAIAGCAGSDRQGGMTTTAYPIPSATPPADGVTHQTLPDIPAAMEGQVDLALARQPRLAAARAVVDRERAKASGAGYYPDPMLQISPLGRMAQTAAGEVTLMATLSQRFPFPGKLDAATAAADSSRAMADAAAEATAASITAELRRTWWRRWDSVRSLAVIDEQRDIVRRLQGVAQSRVAAGRGGQEDLLRLDVELGGLDVQASALRAVAAAAEARIRRLIQVPSATPLPAPPADLPPPIAAARALSDWQAIAIARSPAIQEAQALRAQALARVRQARLDRYPDLTLGFTYNQVADDGLAKSANGQDQWWVSVGLNLPLWTGRLDAAEAAAAADRRRAHALDLDASSTATDRVAEAWAASTAAAEQLRLLDTDILPAARQALRVVESRYAASSASYQDLIEAWRRLLSQDLARVRTQAAHGLADADLLEASGLAVPPASSVHDETAP
jgi:outer membrane protein, heavy metal efflux system